MKQPGQLKGCQHQTSIYYTLSNFIWGLWAAVVRIRIEQCLKPNSTWASLKMNLCPVHLISDIPFFEHVTNIVHCCISLSAIHCYHVPPLCIQHTWVQWLYCFPCLNISSQSIMFGSRHCYGCQIELDLDVLKPGALFLKLGNVVCKLSLQIQSASWSDPRTDRILVLHQV